MARKKRSLTAEESALWLYAMRNTKPLETPRIPKSPDPAPVQPPPSPKISSKTQPKAGKKTQAGPVKPPPSNPVAAPKSKTPAPHHRPGLDAATTRKVRRGRIAVEARLDLHGMRQHEAHGALSRFVLSCSARGKRCVLVITGKGGRADREFDEQAEFMRGRSEGEGILRRALPQWLALEPLRSKVFATEMAHPKDGGSGAVYLFLRRP